MKSKLKYESIRAATILIKEAIVHKDLPRCLAATLAIESFLADRLQSYLVRNDKNFIQSYKNSYISTGIMLDKCIKDFPNYKIAIKMRSGEELESQHLFEECKLWIKNRNIICHQFITSEKAKEYINYQDFKKLAVVTAEEGHKLVKLVSKWHNQLKKNKVYTTQ